ncbi:hypothetical protein IPF37_03240 [bacterium]|nr:MAG: hypothetical protein IPF37_03240 [bacterium]
MNMKNSIRNIFVFIFSVFIVIGMMPFCLPKSCGSAEIVLNLREQNSQHQASFEDVYYELVKSGHFGDLYNNNLIIDPIIDDHFTENGASLLCLVEWLQQQSDFDSAFLLKRMSKFFCLEFQRLLSKIEAPKKIQATLCDDFSRIYNHKVVLEEQSIKPFRATLTKAIIFIFIISYSELHYLQKKEALVFYLEKIKKEFRLINGALSGQSLDENLIAQFVSRMQVYALQEPLVETRSIKRWLLYGSITLVVVGVIGYYINKVGVEKIKRDIKEVWKSLLEEVSDVVAERFMVNPEVKKAAQGMADKVDGLVAKTVNDIGVIVNGPKPAESGEPVVGDAPVANKGLATGIVDQLDQRVNLTDKVNQVKDLVQRVETIGEYKTRAAESSVLNPFNWPQKIIARTLPDVKGASVQEAAAPVSSEASEILSDDVPPAAQSRWSWFGSWLFSGPGLFE